MADLYSQSYAPRASSQYQMSSSNSIVYPNQLVSTHTPHQSSSVDHDDEDTPPKSAEASSPTDNKPPQKTQSTFLTKLYAYMSRLPDWRAL